MKTVTILGSTGSIGKSTVDLLAAAPDRYRVLALVANSSAEALAAQARLLRAEMAVCSDPAMHRTLTAALAGSGIRVACGQDAVLAAARLGADYAMAAITGPSPRIPTSACRGKATAASPTPSASPIASVSVKAAAVWRGSPALRLADVRARRRMTRDARAWGAWAALWFRVVAPTVAASEPRSRGVSRWWWIIGWIVIQLSLAAARHGH